MYRVLAQYLPSACICPSVISWSSTKTAKRRTMQTMSTDSSFMVQKISKMGWGRQK